MKLFVLTLFLAMTTPAAGQSEIEALLKKADTAISPAEEPVKPQVKKKARRQKKKTVKREKPPKKEHQKSELQFSKDPKLTELLQFEQKTFRKAQEKLPLWTFAISTHSSEEYVLEKDDDEFRTVSDQRFQGVQIGYSPFVLARNGNTRISTAFNVGILNPTFRVQRKGLQEEEALFTHHIFNLDAGVRIYRPISDRVFASSVIMASVASVMQDGTGDTDTVFSVRPGVAVRVDIGRKFSDVWSLGIFGGYRNQKIGSAVGPLGGPELGLALSYDAVNG